ncbi:Con-6 domain-containing protein [Rhizoctonia solani AG-1 IA]|uniref:Con-6 domain-containing protein n=1 Tax=Thanatephorus cucumeris (strain AG1-IA) TaxID=983506 RepID=L8WV33_THACA|nr:Con-6 domain-containing protein [Rhizoctonia solani AG-1 IA]
MFGTRSRSRTTRHTTHHSTRTRSTHQRRGLFNHKKNPNRRAAGYKVSQVKSQAALSNPNTTHEGRKHAKRELKVAETRHMCPWEPVSNALLEFGRPLVGTNTNELHGKMI